MNASNISWSLKHNKVSHSLRPLHCVSALSVCLLDISAASVVSFTLHYFSVHFRFDVLWLEKRVFLHRMRKNENFFRADFMPTMFIAIVTNFGGNQSWLLS